MKGMGYLYVWIILIALPLYSESIQLRTASVNATLGEAFTFMIEEVVNKKIIKIVIKYSAHSCYLRLNSNRCMVDGYLLDVFCPFITGYEIECKYANHTITLTIPGQHMLEHFHKTQWSISNRRTGRLAMKILYINVPVTNVTLLAVPTDTNPVDINQGSTRLFSCTTNAGRPPSKIQWYIGNVDITDLAVPQPDVCNTNCSDDIVISSSELNYTGRSKDDSKAIYCTVVNIDGQETTRSKTKTINIKVIATGGNQHSSFSVSIGAGIGSTVVVIALLIVGLYIVRRYRLRNEAEYATTDNIRRSDTDQHVYSELQRNEDAAPDRHDGQGASAYIYANIDS